VETKRSLISNLSIKASILLLKNQCFCQFSPLVKKAIPGVPGDTRNEPVRAVCYLSIGAGNAPNLQKNPLFTVSRFSAFAVIAANAVSKAKPAELDGICPEDELTPRRPHSRNTPWTYFKRKHHG
jgi:hypothetical protein